MRRRSLPPLLFALAALTACASRSQLPPVPGPEEIPTLEAMAAGAPEDAEVGLLLASAYRADGRLDQAAAIVTEIRTRDPEDPGALVMQGLIAEDRGDFEGARIAYAAIVEGGRGGGALREEVERRLEIVRREELRARVTAALAREDDIAQTSPDRGAVGVFPFLYEGTDPDWAPLAYALPEMLSTDLGVTGRLRVVERMHVQALLDEIALGESGRVDEAVAARSGRLLGSGTIVQGRLSIRPGNEIGVDAAVVEVGDGAPGVDPLSDAAVIEQIFALEKRLALQIHEEMGIALTPAERQRINERQTENIQALLAFGEGLAAEARGDFSTARDHYARASNMDPNFSMAVQRGRAADQMIPQSAAALAQVTAIAQNITSKRQAVQLLQNAPAGLRNRVLQSLGVTKRAVVQELTGQDRLGQTILLEIVFRPPGGTE